MLGNFGRPLVNVVVVVPEEYWTYLMGHFKHKSCVIEDMCESIMSNLDWTCTLAKAAHHSEIQISLKETTRIYTLFCRLEQVYHSRRVQ